MEYREKLNLISKVETQDSIGNIISTESSRMVYAKKNFIGVQEYYNAVSVGITPAIQLQIRALNYNNEGEVDYNNERYNVIRTKMVDGDIVLILAHKEGN